MKCELCFPLKSHKTANVRKFTLPSSGKRVSAKVSLALVPDLSNYALFIAIHDVYYGFRVAITAYSYTDKATDGKKVRYIIRLAVKCNQNDTYVKDQAVDAVQA